MRAFRRVATVLGVAFLLSLTAPAGAATPGRAWAVGNNTEGQLGDGTLTPRSVPAEVLGLSGVQAVAAGSTHSLALRGDGTVWSWGYNANGQLGDGTIIGDRVTPVRVVGLSGVRAIAAGFYNGFALLTDGTVWAWGAGPCGELGDGDTFSQNRPVRSFRNLRVKAVAAGANHNLAALGDGTMRGWGNNGHGQLGDGAVNIVQPTR